MSLVSRIVNSSIKTFLDVTCRIDKDQLNEVPKEGPLILVSNHVSSLEVPLFYTFLQPRKILGFAKSEFWENPLSGFLFDMWKAIPIHRGTVDLKAFRLAYKALEEGYILAVAPEGTRSWNGQLQRAQPGVVMMALHSNIPILPLAHHGGEKFKQNLSHFHRTDFHIRIGRRFKLDAGGVRVTTAIRQQMADEIMFQVAALLPPEYRGYYTDMDKATEKYLRFI